MKIYIWTKIKGDIDVGDMFKMLVTDVIHCKNHQHNEKSRHHNDSFTNILNRSPSKNHQHNVVAKLRRETIKFVSSEFEIFRLYRRTDFEYNFALQFWPWIVLMIHGPVRMSNWLQQKCSFSTDLKSEI